MTILNCRITVEKRSFTISSERNACVSWSATRLHMADVLQPRDIGPVARQSIEIEPSSATVARVGPTHRRVELHNAERERAKLRRIPRNSIIFQECRQEAQLRECSAFRRALFPIINRHETGSRPFEFQKLVETGTIRLRNVFRVGLLSQESD
jgi:hypothetical protein